jgi:Putative metallopeptidase
MRSDWKLGLALAWLAACGSEEPKDDEHADRGDIKVSWSTASDSQSRQLAQVLRDERLFEELASGLNATLKFPRDLPVVHTECGEANAFYDPNTRSLSMCYELLNQIASVANDGQSTEQELGDRIVGTWLFVFFHELGHGLVDMYDLPITGREEDSVDDFSTVLMVQAGLEEYVLHAAEYWAATGSNMFDDLNFADEHSLNQQRFYNILCLVYGSNPRAYDGLVTNGYLPEARAQRCPAEFEQKENAWNQLLAGWEK